MQPAGILETRGAASADRSDSAGAVTSALDSTILGKGARLVFPYRRGSCKQNAGELRFAALLVASPSLQLVPPALPRSDYPPILNKSGASVLIRCNSNSAHQKVPTGSECGNTARVQKPTPRCIVACGWSTTASGAGVKLPRAASRSAAINRPSARGSARMRIQTLRRSITAFSGTSGRLIESESYILPIRNKIKTISRANPMPPLGP